VGALCRPLNRNLFVHSVLGAAQWTNGLGCQWWWQCGGGALQHGMTIYTYVQYNDKNKYYAYAYMSPFIYV